MIITPSLFKIAMKSRRTQSTAFLSFAMLSASEITMLPTVVNNGSTLVYALLGGLMAACLAISIYLYRENLVLKKQVSREKTKNEIKLKEETQLHALIYVEPQIFIVWNDVHADLVVHTLTAVKGVPANLSQLVRFSTWLYPEDATQLNQHVDELRRSGTGFTLKICNLEGFVLEALGSVCGGDAVLRIRRLSAVHKDFAKVMGENKRLKQGLQDRNALLDKLPFPVWLRDNKGQLTWVNAAYAKSVSASNAEQVLSLQIELFETRQRKELQQALLKKHPDRLRLQTVINGNLHLYDAITAPINKGSCGAAFDVAALASAQNELERQMLAHSRTLEKVSTGVAIFGADRKLSYNNNALLQIWSLDESFVRQKPTASEFIDWLRHHKLLPEQSNYRKWRDERILAWSPSAELNELWHLPDGRSIKVLSDYRDDGGATFLFDDVTEKIALERRYHSLIEVQRETLDHLGEGLAVFGSDGRLQLFNPTFQIMWQLPEAALDGSPHVDEIARSCQVFTSASAKEFWKLARSVITTITEAREAVSGTLEHTGRTHLSYAAMPLPDGGTLLTFADITASKRIEEVLLERNEALEASDRLKSAFLSHVSYELRTPLTSIIGFTDMLSEPHFGTLTQKQHEYLADIRTSSRVLLNIINDILDLAVIDAGALDLKLEPLKITDLIEAAELGVKERLSRQKIQLDVHIAENLQSVIADRNRMTQVLYNLLSNAIGFSPEGSTITLACRPDKGGVEFSVQDRGLGIPEEDQVAIFERFQSRTQGSRHRGAGLGLSLVKSLVELHNGRLSLRSTPGAGTTVTVFLPDRHLRLDSDSFKRAS